MYDEIGTAPPRTLTAAIAQHALAFRSAPIPDAARTVAKQCILDWFGVTLAGLDEPVARILTQTMAPGSQGPCTIIGRPGTVAPETAALVNGTTSHALDYDDVQRDVGHPTVAVLPAVLAVAELCDATGEEVLRAFVAGVEIAAAIGALAAPSHYARGFHTTATIGAFGAAAAAGTLLRLDAAAMGVALGLAGTQAAGLKAMFGSMAKPFHAGKAASNGVLAARLAAAGMSAHADVLGVTQGFLHTQVEGGVPRPRDLPAPGTRIGDTLFKYHAACYLTHSMMDALRTVRDRHAIDSDAIEAISVHVPAGHLAVCNIPSPVTGLETKFSLRHCAAFITRGLDTAAIATFSDANARDPDLMRLRERVTVHGDMPAGMAARVEVTAAGQRVAGESDVGVPARDLARQGERLDAKFASLAHPVLGEARATRLRAKILGLETAPTLQPLMTPA